MPETDKTYAIKERIRTLGGGEQVRVVLSGLSYQQALSDCEYLRPRGREWWIVEEAAPVGGAA